MFLRLKNSGSLWLRLESLCSQGIEKCYLGYFTHRYRVGNGGGVYQEDRMGAGWISCPLELESQSFPN